MLHFFNRLGREAQCMNSFLNRLTFSIFKGKIRQLIFFVLFCFARLLCLNFKQGVNTFFPYQSKDQRFLGKPLLSGNKCSGFFVRLTFSHAEGVGNVTGICLTVPLPRASRFRCAANNLNSFFSSSFRLLQYLEHIQI